MWRYIGWENGELLVLVAHHGQQLRLTLCAGNLDILLIVSPQFVQINVGIISKPARIAYSTAGISFRLCTSLLWLLW